MTSGTWSGIEPTCSKGGHKHQNFALSLLILSFTQAMRLVEMFRVNCPADAVGGALGSILGLALLVSIVVHIVALVIILCLYYGKIKRVANTNKMNSTKVQNPRRNS